MPGRNSAEVPGWLVAAGDGDAFSIQEWFDAMDKLFNCDSYLQSYFETAKHLQEPEATLETACEDLQANGADLAAKHRLAEAERWLRRVLNWIQNLVTDLHADAIAAPGESEKRWLFTLVEWKDKWPSEAGVFTCRLCKDCLRPLSKTAPSGRPQPSTPKFA